jgi:hypothetical protein
VKVSVDVTLAGHLRAIAQAELERLLVLRQQIEARIHHVAGVVDELARCPAVADVNGAESTAVAPPS